jgi:DNA repair exonuclease SbcCD ATPase subunit
MSFNFLKNLLIVKSESIEDGIINLATTLDKEGVAETAIRQKIEEHEERIKMLQEATAEYHKEQKEYEQELSLYTRYMNEAEAIQGILEQLSKAKETIVTDPSNQEAADIISKYNQAELTSDLSKILDKVEERSSRLEKEKQDAIEAEAWMKEVKEAVDEISKELLTLRETVNDVKREIKQAELEKERNRKRSEQAEAIAGLRKSSNKFDVAINALKNKAAEEQKIADTYKIKAESLKIPVQENIIGKYTTVENTVSSESLTERLSRLKSKA